MADTGKTKPKTGGDVLIHRESLQYNMVSATLKFPKSGGTHDLDQVAGYPGIYNATNEEITLIFAAGTTSFNEKASNCLLLHGAALADQADGATTEQASLYSAILDADGLGVVINETALPTQDVASSTTTGALTLADIKAAMTNFKYVTEAPATAKSTQTG